VNKVKVSAYAARWNKSASVIRNYLVKGRLKSAEKINGMWYIDLEEPLPPHKDKRKKKKKDTLCWECQKYYKNCDWTRTLKLPVKGWTAKQTDLEGNTGFLVIACPEYVPDEPEGRRTGNAGKT